MIHSWVYLLLAAFGLGVLIFIHELGHYWMARRQGMTVEAFSIGFGKPLFVWEYQGVKWQFCWLPFGGYVKIAGMEKRGSLEPYQIPDGFYGKKPLARIKVALMGPLVNIAFAFLVFCVLWVSGGRLKSFSEYTHLIGWTDPASGLYQAGIRAGDEITQLNAKPFHGFNDFLYAAVLDDASPCLQGWEIDYFAQERKPFSYLMKTSEELKGMDRAALMMGTLGPANYLIYSRHSNGAENPLPQTSPMLESGIQYGDRLLWADGELIFSKRQLIATINEPKALLTVRRGDKQLLARVPRLQISDLRITSDQKAELDDWQHAAQIKGKLPELFFIPYNLTPDCRVESSLSYLNDNSQEQLPMTRPRASYEDPLLAGDQILAVDGAPISGAYALFDRLQTRHVQIIVKKEGDLPIVSSEEADKVFDQGINWKEFAQIIDSIGTAAPLQEIGNLRMLQPVVPKPFNEFPLPEEMKMRLANELSSQRKAIEEIHDPKERAAALRMLEENQKKLMLGITLQDRQVQYNPSPWAQFCGVFQEVWRTLIALFTGILSPKWLAGPVGIVQVMHHNWMIGFKEALFWMGMISLNLGILNLLPVPVLDGGHICFALWESITKKPIKAKTMERLVIPFIILLIAFFIYVTYHDLVRLLGRFL